MRIIVDTNRIISALIKEGLTRDVITSEKIEFYSLDYVTEEVRKYIEYIISKSTLNKKEIELLFMLLMEKINIVPDEKIKTYMKEATNIMKNIDERDAPIMACALAVPNEGIWTEDKHFKQQDKVRVWATEELSKYI